MFDLRGILSESSAAGNAKILFGRSHESVLKNLRAYARSPLLNAPVIQVLLDYVKNADEDELTRYKDSAPGKRMVSNLKKFLTAKSFETQLDSLKAMKPTRAMVDVAGGVAPTPKPTTINPNPTPAPAQAGGLRPLVGKKLAAYNELIAVVETGLRENFDATATALDTALDEIYANLGSNMPTLKKHLSDFDGLAEQGAIETLLQVAGEAKVFGKTRTILNRNLRQAGKAATVKPPKTPKTPKEPKPAAQPSGNALRPLVGKKLAALNELLDVVGPSLADNFDETANALDAALDEIFTNLGSAMPDLNDHLSSFNGLAEQGAIETLLQVAGEAKVFGKARTILKRHLRQIGSSAPAQPKQPKTPKEPKQPKTPTLTAAQQTKLNTLLGQVEANASSHFMEDALQQAENELANTLGNDFDQYATTLDNHGDLSQGRDAVAAFLDTATLSRQFNKVYGIINRHVKLAIKKIGKSGGPKPKPAQQTAQPAAQPAAQPKPAPTAVTDSGAGRFIPDVDRVLDQILAQANVVIDARTTMDARESRGPVMKAMGSIEDQIDGLYDLLDDKDLGIDLDSFADDLEEFISEQGQALTRDELNAFFESKVDAGELVSNHAPKPKPAGVKPKPAGGPAPKTSGGVKPKTAGGPTPKQGNAPKQGTEPQANSNNYLSWGALSTAMLGVNGDGYGPEIADLFVTNATEPHTAGFFDQVDGEGIFYYPEGDNSERQIILVDKDEYISEYQPAKKQFAVYRVATPLLDEAEEDDVELLYEANDFSKAYQSFKVFCADPTRAAHVPSGQATPKPSVLGSKQADAALTADALAELEGTLLPLAQLLVKTKRDGNAQDEIEYIHDDIQDTAEVLGATIAKTNPNIDAQQFGLDFLVAVDELSRKPDLTALKRIIAGLLG